MFPQKLNSIECDYYDFCSSLKSSLISTSRSSAILTKVSIGGWQALVHHLLTVVGAQPNCSDNHLLVLFLSTSTTFIRFSIFILLKLLFWDLIAHCQSPNIHLYGWPCRGHLSWMPLQFPCRALYQCGVQVCRVDVLVYGDKHCPRQDARLSCFLVAEDSEEHLQIAVSHALYKHYRYPSILFL